MNERPRYGGLWRRLAAAGLDLFLAANLLLAIDVVLAGAGVARWPLPALPGLLLPICLAACWHWFGGTPGKLVLGLVVVDARRQRRIGWGRALLRALAYLASALPLGLGFLWMGLDRQKRALHDLIAGTRVIHEPLPPLTELERSLS